MADMVKRITLLVVSLLVLLLATPVTVFAERPSAVPAGEPSADSHDVQPLASVYCPSVWNGTDNRAHAICDVYSGEVRVRADCRFWPDTYSPWRGPGLGWYLQTGVCPFGFGGPPIIETRG